MKPQKAKENLMEEKAGNLERSKGGTDSGAPDSPPETLKVSKLDVEIFEVKTQADATGSENKPEPPTKVHRGL